MLPSGPTLAGVTHLQLRTFNTYRCIQACSLVGRGRCRKSLPENQLTISTLGSLVCFLASHYSQKDAKAVQFRRESIMTLTTAEYVLSIISPGQFPQTAHSSSLSMKGKRGRYAVSKKAS